MRHYLKAFWRHNFLVVIVLLITSALQVGTNLIMIQAFQQIIGLDFYHFFIWISILIATWIALLWINALEVYLEGRAVRAMNNRVRQDIANSLLHKKHHEYHETTTGEYLSWLTNNVNQIENLAWRPFYSFIKAIATVIFSIVALLMLHWSLLIASLITTIIMFFIPNLFNSKMESLGRVSAQKQAAATGTIKDLLSGFDVLRAFSRETRFLHGIQSASEQIEYPKFRLSYVKGIAGAGIGCVNVICQILLNLLIGFLSIKGIILQGALLGGGNICGALSSGLGTLTQFLLSFSSSKPFFEKIDNTSDNDIIVYDKQEEINKDISLDNVSFSYGNTPVLHNISLRFKKGGKYAIIGPSGCGKTTILKLLLGWLPSYTGTILIDGIDSRTYNPNQMLQWMSYIEQDIFLFNSTIRDNITLGEDFSDKQIEDALVASALNADIETLPDGINTQVGEEGSNLSGGQRQRVAIARALIHKRSILLIDEGTSALDQKNADIIENSLLSNPDLTLIMVSHHLSVERQKQFTYVFNLQSLQDKTKPT